ncbi:MAG: 16S rRNA (adenine(1518)-N(6)/adenine(1519)-N(6))-dimethyltransferase RsmA [Treponema sp.]|nr:16S rRNA (adenine(1518)-N(6)/adenine(1519)-N(6))-dimethyltransferase RsmA [Treponema sp.]
MNAENSINYNSPAALKAFLEQEGLGMQKKFGQNFLINPQVRKDLVQVMELKSGDCIWEIGPGLGVMTELLLEKGANVKAFEIDNGFIRVLKNIFSENKNFTIVEGDVMKTWQKHPPVPYLLGNLPYNIAAVLLADFIEKGRQFSRMAVTVQKEVALRMMASAGSPDYSSFSVMCASVYSVKPIMTIRPSSFFPQPNVDSMGVLLVNRLTGEKFPEIFFPLVRALFASRRKTIKNNLITFLSPRHGKIKTLDICASVLHENAVNENERAENLDFNAFLSLAKSIDNMRL